MYGFTSIFVFSATTASLSIHAIKSQFTKPQVSIHAQRAIHFALLQIRLMRNKQKEQDASKTRRTVDF